MVRWKGETITVQVGDKWTYKLRLEEDTGAGAQSKLFLATKVFDTQEEAKTAGDAHLKEELDKRPS